MAYFIDPDEARVRCARKKLTAASLARAMGLSQETVWRWLNARRPVPLVRIPALLQHIGPERGLWQRREKRGA